MGTGRHLPVSAVWPGWAHPLDLVPLPFLRTLPSLSCLLAPEAQRRRMAAGAVGTDSEAA